MDCSWVQTLRGPQVRDQEPRVWFTIPFVLNGQAAWALIDTGCGRTLTKTAQGPFAPEHLKMKCAHRDIKEYCAKVVLLKLDGVGFTCHTDVVPHLACPVLIGRNCPILHLLLGVGKTPSVQLKVETAMQGAAVETKWRELPLGLRELAHLTEQDPTLVHAQEAATSWEEPQGQGPRFTLSKGLLY